MGQMTLERIRELNDAARERCKRMHKEPPPRIERRGGDGVYDIHITRTTDKEKTMTTTIIPHAHKAVIEYVGEHGWATACEHFEIDEETLIKWLRIIGIAEDERRIIPGKGRPLRFTRHEAESIRRLHEEEGWSVTELAHHFDASRPTIYKAIRGEFQARYDAAGAAGL